VSEPPRTALVAGASGLVGRECLRRLSADEAVREVRALVRRALPQALSALPRVRECRTELDRTAEHAEWFAADWVFCALGTTIKKAGTREAFRRVDFDYPLAVARLARERGAAHFLLVSARGADPRSSFFYNRVKGELEEAVKALGYPSLTIARPSLLLGERDEFRLGEELAKPLGWLLPPSSRPVHAAQVAAALVRAAHESRPGVRIIGNAELRAMA
jgi:uncharacterized protein YbjT (DUF2867 family)